MRYLIRTTSEYEMPSKLAYAAVLATLGQLHSTVPTLAGSVSDPVFRLPPFTTDEPFGSSTVRGPIGLLADKWQQALTNINADLAILSNCRAQPNRGCSPAATRFVSIVERAGQHEGFAKLSMINSGVNAVIRRDLAEEVAGTDPWPTPLATFTAGHGVCMHFAIAKYTALLLGGWPAKDLRLVMVWPDRADRPHMVLAAHHSGHWYILDNLRSAVVIDGKATNYVPLFVFDYRSARQLDVSNGANLLSQPENEGSRLTSLTAPLLK
jgi:predicted transglutaminase-like cysteine proteinase